MPIIAAVILRPAASFLLLFSSQPPPLQTILQLELTILWPELHSWILFLLLPAPFLRSSCRSTLPSTTETCAMQTSCVCSSPVRFTPLQGQSKVSSAPQGHGSDFFSAPPSGPSSSFYSAAQWQLKSCSHRTTERRKLFCLMVASKLMTAVVSLYPFLQWAVWEGNLVLVYVTTLRK